MAGYMFGGTQGKPFSCTLVYAEFMLSDFIDILYHNCMKIHT